jgi:flavin reductase (DIM6/NTAB) family NADH-FMN oxidoreductase RutF
VSASRKPVATKPQSIEAVEFREAMSRVASPVAIVTTDGPGGRAGFTCTAFASVSDDPPTVLVCLNQASRSAAAFRANPAFAINVLPERLRALADRFSGLDGTPLSERFASETWQAGSGGAPLLEGALASLDCHMEEVQRIGSHQMMIGRVLSVRLGPGEPPLFYHRRAYRSFDGA